MPVRDLQCAKKTQRILSKDDKRRVFHDRSSVRSTKSFRIEYEYRFTEYEYDEDRNAFMPEQLIIPPINGDKGLSAGLCPLGTQLSPLVANGDNVLSSQLYPLVTNGDKGLSIRLYPLTAPKLDSNLLGVQAQGRVFF